LDLRYIIRKTITLRGQITGFSVLLPPLRRFTRSSNSSANSSTSELESRGHEVDLPTLQAQSLALKSRPGIDCEHEKRECLETSGLKDDSLPVTDIFNHLTDKLLGLADFQRGDLTTGSTSDYAKPNSSTRLLGSPGSDVISDPSTSSSS
jgi:hypothetical protein